MSRFERASVHKPHNPTPPLTGFSHFVIQAEKRIGHHDLCFGCGLGNRFGLQLELEAAGEGAAAGRFFVKQDHQGPAGLAHGGVLAAALEEAMSLALDSEPATSLASMRIDLHGQAPVGTYVQVSARIERHDGRKRSATAELRDQEGELLAEAETLFVDSGPAEADHA
jgi:acyl-coenzyme A thioesterase PaaI-like protein